MKTVGWNSWLPASVLFRAQMDTITRGAKTFSASCSLSWGLLIFSHFFNKDEKYETMSSCLWTCRVYHFPLLVPEIIDPVFRENQPKRSFSIKWKRAFWACFRENWVYKFGHCSLDVHWVSLSSPPTTAFVHFRSQHYGRAGCIPFHRQLYGRAGCFHFRSHAVWTCGVYPLPPPAAVTNNKHTLRMR